MRNPKTIAGRLCCWLCAAALLLAGCGGEKAQPTDAETMAIQTTSIETTSAQTTAPAPTVEGQLEYGGKTYLPREGIQTLLLMGLDKYERPENAIGYTNKLQSDFLLLVVIDENAKTVELLHLNRDTMTTIRRLGVGGGAAGTFTGQLALAHTYGSGGSDSCLNAVKAVSTLLDGVPIDHYMTLTMDAVGQINDLVGGVSVTVLDDFSEIDPALEQGKEVTLRGDQALVYVRTRLGLEDSSNLHRMERQRQYLAALYAKLMERSRANGDFLAKTLLTVSDSMVSDCTVNQLETLGDLLTQCTIAPIRTLEGKAVLGEEYIEFYVDEDSLRDTVLALFYREA